MQLATPIEPAIAVRGLPLPLLKEGCSSLRCYPMHDITPRVPAMAVRMAMIILSICFQSISFMFVLSLEFSV